MNKKIGTIEKSGKIISIKSNSQISLNNPEKIWIMLEGSLDIFSIKLKNKKSASNRKYIFSVKENTALFGSNIDPGIEIIASISQDTKLVELSYAKLKNIYSKKEHKGLINNLIESWAISLLNGLLDKKNPRRYISLESSKKFEFAENQTLMVKDNILWVKILSGGLILQDINAFELSKNDDYFPCSDFSWLNVKEPGICSIMKLEKFLISKNLQEIILNFNDKVLKLALFNLNNIDKIETDRIEAKRQNDDSILESGFKKLASTMGIKFKSDVSAFLKEGVLYATCVAVGRVCKIDIKLPQRGNDSLKEIANASQFKFRDVILKDKWWASDCGPLLCFKESDNKPVAVLPLKKNIYEIYDVEKNSREIITEANCITLKPLAYSFYRPFPLKKIKIFDLLRFGAENTWISDIVVVIIVSIIGGILGLVVPIATGMVFNSILPQAERSQLTQVGFFLFVSAMAVFMFNLTKAIALLRIESKMDYSIQSAVWDRIISLPASFFKDYTAGDLAMRGTCINQIRKTLSGSAIMSILSGIFSLFNFLLLFYYSSGMAKIATILVLISIAVTITCGYLNLKNTRKTTDIDGKISGFVLQLIGGISKFKVSGSEKRAFSLWSDKFSTKRKFQYNASLKTNIVQVFSGVYPVLCSMVIFYFMIHSKTIKLETGNFLAFNSSFTSFMVAMLTLSQTFISTLSIIPLYERAKPILESLPEYDESKENPGELRGNIEVSHISFKYGKDSPLILDDVSLYIKEGEFVALVGPSGSGKSTLFRLLLGFETPEYGAIYYDGQDMSTLDIRSIRNQLGVVIQNGKIMSGDIFSNIVGGSSLTVEDAWEAAEMAGLANDIKEMPMGMYTVVSEGGSTFSGGQRQRLLIARAIVNKPKIIYFDEATSALDNKTQSIVSSSLDKINATRVIIAHRLSTVINADKIFVIEKGRVVQSGTYEELMKVEGTFKELAKRQIV